MKNFELQFAIPMWEASNRARVRLMWQVKAVLAALGWAMAITAAQAASFDCNRATSKTEKLICSSPDLSALDEKLAAAYRAAQSGASIEQREQLATAQKVWLKSIRNNCDNEACLEKAYAARISLLARTAPQESSGMPFSPANTLATNSAPVGKGFPTILPSIDGDLVYSHYDDNGNTKSIVQFDFTTGKWTNLVTGKTDPALIAQDTRYIVFHTPHSASFPIEIINRKTGTVLARKRLAKPVSNAFILGDKLVLFQGQTGSFTFQQSVAILELPSLKLAQETTLPGAYLVGIHGDRIYTAFSANAKGDLLVFDRQLKELGRIQIPPPLEKINANCQPSIEQNENDRAVLIANCGEIHTLNLKSFSVVHSFRRYALFYSMALHDGLIFTTATDQSANSHDEIVVFDMEEGREVARLPISASTIAIKGNILLAAGMPISTGTSASWPMETYQIHTAAIRNGSWQQSRVVQQCRQAQLQLAGTKDVYQAISLCEKAGMDGYFESSPIPPTVFPTLRQYGLWLSQTLDKSPKAIRVLEKIEATKPDPEVTSALVEARLKAKVIGGKAIRELTVAERQTEFGKILESGSQLTRAVTKTIEFGDFSNLFHFSDNQLYVGRYGCRTTRCNGGATIGVFDRNTLDELASIPVAPNDDDYQDGIDSITTDKDHIYASVSYRYEQEGRPNFFVIDRHTLKVTKRAQVKPIGTLHFDQGKLMTCVDEPTEKQACAELNPSSLDLREISGKIFLRQEYNNEPIINVNGKLGATERVVATTQDYLITHDQLDSHAGYAVYTRAKGEPLPQISGLGDALDRIAAISGNLVLIRQGTLSEEVIKVVSIPSGTTRALLGLPTMPLHASALALHEKKLYIGYGRDLLIYDFKDDRLKRYIRDFIPSGFRDNGSGLDANRIERLIIDQGKLIALTFYGANSRIIRLNEL